MGRREEAIEAVAKIIAGRPPCYCPDDWRAPKIDNCPAHDGTTGYLDLYRKKADAILSSPEVRSALSRESNPEGQR